jgi:LTXXQ motif family protein
MEGVMAPRTCTLATFLAFSALVAAPLSASAQGQPDQQGRTRTPGMMGERMMGMGQQDVPWMGMPMMPGDWPTMDMPGRRWAMGPGMMADSQWVEGRIGFLRAELAVTPEQEKAFSGLADALRASAKSMNEMHRSMPAMMGAVTAPERYDAHVRMMEARLAGMKAVSDALPGSMPCSPNSRSTRPTSSSAWG